MIVTIDGPAGSGKSTVARKLAWRLGVAYLDTGATYRAATLAAIRSGANLGDEDALARITRNADIRLTPEPDSVRVTLDGEDVSDVIRSAEVSEKSWYIARSPKVRKVLVALQRRIGRELGDFVAEGRDQGSVVFPDADVKFFLDASCEVRAKRRYDEMRASGQQADYEEVLAAIVERDRRDRSRPVAPLIRPDDAVAIDTSEMPIADVVDALARNVEQRR